MAGGKQKRWKWQSKKPKTRSMVVVRNSRITASPAIGDYGNPAGMIGLTGTNARLRRAHFWRGKHARRTRLPLASDREDSRLCGLPLQLSNAGKLSILPGPARIPGRNGDWFRRETQNQQSADTQRPQPARCLAPGGIGEEMAGYKGWRTVVEVLSRFRRAVFCYVHRHNEQARLPFGSLVHCHRPEAFMGLKPSKITKISCGRCFQEGTDRTYTPRAERISA